MTFPIGGYFELELNTGREYHSKAILLNSGRNCLEFILSSKKYNKIFLPFYICDEVIDKVKNLNIDFEFYQIDKNLDPVFFSKISKNDAFLYVNYFGIKKETVRYLSQKVVNLIIDNSQAFFEKPIKGVDTFYSPRKFFGVPDGGYLFTDKRIDLNLDQDLSFLRMQHLLVRLDNGAENGYSLFLGNEKELGKIPLRNMSNITRSLLCNIDYKTSKQKRNLNFRYLHNALKEKNELTVDVKNINSPMVYPFLCRDGKGLKPKLLQKKVFVPTYWGSVLKNVSQNSFEYHLVNNLIPLPVDQRYSIKDMNWLILLLKKFF